MSEYSIDNKNEEKEDKKRDEEVPDNGNLVYLFMVIFGIGSILPFSATTTAIEFFNKQLLKY